MKRAIAGLLLVFVFLAGSTAWTQSTEVRVELPAKAHRHAWKRGGDVKKDIEFKYTPVVTFKEDGIDVAIGASVTRHRDAFWSVTGEMDFAGADWPVNKVVATYGDGRSVTKEGGLFHSATATLPAGPLTGLELHGALVGHDWSVEWDVRPPARERTDGGDEPRDIDAAGQLEEDEDRPPFLHFVIRQGTDHTPVDVAQIGETVYLQAEYGKDPEIATKTAELVTEGNESESITLEVTRDPLVFRSGPITLTAHEPEVVQP